MNLFIRNHIKNLIGLYNFIHSESCEWMKLNKNKDF